MKLGPGDYTINHQNYIFLNVNFLKPLDNIDKTEKQKSSQIYT